MQTENEIVNRVTNSGLVTLSLEDYYVPGERVILDIKDQLFEGLILREKDFRTFIKTNDWSVYNGKFVAITCSADAIVPTWAYLLLVSVLQPVAREIVFGGLEDLEKKLFYDSLSKIDWNQFRDQRVVVKGCSKVEVPTAIYVEAGQRLMTLAASIMFGEPCSTVPVYKRPKI